jgi:hypothetical protein
VPDVLPWGERDAEIQRGARKAGDAPSRPQFSRRARSGDRGPTSSARIARLRIQW